MDKEHYQQVRKELGFTVTFWIKKLGIELDTHKSFNSGRRKITPMISNHIETLLELKKVTKT